MKPIDYLAEVCFDLLDVEEPIDRNARFSQKIDVPSAGVRNDRKL